MNLTYFPPLDSGIVEGVDKQVVVVDAIVPEHMFRGVLKPYY